MQMAQIFSETYNANNGVVEDSDDEGLDLLNTVSDSIDCRTVEGLRIALDIAIHFKVGISFNNKTALVDEFVTVYSRFGDKSNWPTVIQKVLIGSVKNAV